MRRAERRNPGEQAIDLIYETVADSTLWSEVARVIGNEVGATASWLAEPDLKKSNFFCSSLLLGSRDQFVSGALLPDEPTCAGMAKSPRRTGTLGRPSV
jgi:hypothetical protein